MNHKTIIVEGIPKAQPRVKAFVRGGRAGVYTPKTADDWKSAIIEAAKPYVPQLPVEGPVQVEIIYYLKRPQRLMRKIDPDTSIPHEKKPDIDNLNKAVFDALTMVKLWNDDSQVYQITAKKYYHSKSGKPGAAIKIYYQGSDEYKRSCEE